MALLPFSLRVYLWRQWLYIALLLFSGTLVGLTAARLHYTTHLPVGDPLNHGRSFFDRIVAELFAAAAFTFFWAIHMVHTIARSVERGGFFVRIAFELFVLSCFWLLYLVGAAIATSFWGNLSFCWQFEACRLLTALVAFAWIGWITISVLLFTTFVYAFTGRGWTKHSHGRWINNPDAEKGCVTQ
ncbi:hypothetical protein JB92DRAFT_2899620 [Gautieria morchelliformis]|nr:hypothetical protein JB92DRAFT_2899620 [Gautieria morchelliformis]